MKSVFFIGWRVCSSLGKALCKATIELTTIVKIVDKIIGFNLQQKRGHRDQFTLALTKMIYPIVVKIKVNWIRYILYFMATKRTHLWYGNLITHILNYYCIDVWKELFIEHYQWYNCSNLVRSQLISISGRGCGRAASFSTQVPPTEKQYEEEE